MIVDALQRDKYLKIKHFLKLSKKSDKNLNNKTWRVHHVVEIFKKNLQQFDFFTSTYSVYESIIKFFGRCKEHYRISIVIWPRSLNLLC